MGIKKIFNTIKERFQESKPKVETEAVAHIYGEDQPGYIKADVAWYGVDGHPMDRPVRQVTKKLLPRLRPTFNRILVGTATREDEQVIDLFILSR